MISIVKASQSYSWGRPPLDFPESASSRGRDCGFIPSLSASLNRVSNRKAGCCLFRSANARRSSRATRDLLKSPMARSAFREESAWSVPLTIAPVRACKMAWASEYSLPCCPAYKSRGSLSTHRQAACSTVNTSTIAQWERSHPSSPSKSTWGASILKRRVNLTWSYALQRLIPLAPVGSTGGGLDATRAAPRPG